MRTACLVLALLALSACASKLERARTARDRGDVEEAASLYERAIDDPKLAPVARQELATMLAEDADRIRESNPKDAETVYLRALELDPVNGSALTGLVRMLRRGGRHDEAEQVLADAAGRGSCGACNRLRIVLTLDRADKELREEHWDAAIEHYEKAQSMRRQTGPALAIANAHLMAGRSGEAADALHAAVSMVSRGDAASENELVRLRRAIVVAALKEGDLQLADRTREIRLNGEPPDDSVALALSIAEHLMENGEAEAALARYEALLGGEGGLTLSDSQQQQIRDQVVNVYANRGTSHLHAGEADKADEALAKALQLRPDDPVLQLQRILATSESIGAGAAISALGSVPKDTVGWSQTHAILMSQRVLELADAGDIEAAKVVLGKAQETASDLPEVHLAAARLLTETPFELERKERAKMLGRRSMVRYEDEVHCHGEALGEIDLVRDMMRRRDKAKLFTAAWLLRRTGEVEASIKRVYPFAVKFRADPEPQLTLKNTGTGRVEVSLRALDYVDELTLEPDAERRVTLPDPGVVSLTVEGNKQVFLAEPYTAVTLPLGS